MKRVFSKKRMTAYFLFLVIALSLVLSACSSSTQESTGEPEPIEKETDETAEAIQPIPNWHVISQAGTWVLIGKDDASYPTVVEPGTYVTINFNDEEKQVYGVGGCNNYDSTFSADENGNLTITGPIASTRMACETGMEQESLFLNALEKVTGYSLAENGDLLLDYDGGENYKQQLHFVHSTPLLDTLWILTSYGSKASPTYSETGVVTTAILADDGSLVGSAGCNQYTTSYTEEQGGITISPVSLTKKACEYGMEQETAYINLLEQAVQYQIHQNILEITSADGERLLCFSAQHMPLENTAWSLALFDGNTLYDGVVANLLFTPGSSLASVEGNNTVSGYSGCNTFTGPYSFDDDGLNIPDPLAVTMMACEETAMTFEQEYLAAIEGIQSYEIILNQLTLYTDSGILIFHANRLPLEGPTWTLTEMGSVEAPQPLAVDFVITVQFTRQIGMPSGTLSGQFGENNFVTNYFANLSEIKFNLPEPSAEERTGIASDLENTIFIALNTAREYRILGTELFIYYDDSVLIFTGDFPDVTSMN